MPDQIANSFVQDYQNKVYMALKEMGGKFVHTVEHESLVGEGSALLEVIGDTEAYKKTERHSTTPKPYDIKHDKRWVYSEFWRTVAWVDTYDQLKMIIEVKNKYAGLQANAIAVQIDSAIVDALIGVAWTGKKGNIATALPDTQKMYATATTGLTTVKMRRARIKFKKNDVNLVQQKLYIIVDPQQLDDMLEENEVGSSDYNSIKALIDGQITKWMGFEFLEYNNLPFDEDTSIRTTIAYTDKAVVLAKWDSITTHITPRDDHDFDWQIYTKATFGATRIDEKLVVTIGCKEIDIDEL